MTDEQKIQAILASIQTETNLTILLQLIIQTNIGNVSSAQLNTICQALGIPTT